MDNFFAADANIPQNRLVKCSEIMDGKVFQVHRADFARAHVADKQLIFIFGNGNGAVKCRGGFAADAHIKLFMCNRVTDNCVLLGYRAPNLVAVGSDALHRVTVIHQVACPNGFAAVIKYAGFTGGVHKHRVVAGKAVGITRKIVADFVDDFL